MFGTLLTDARYRISALFNRSRMDRELDDELQFHLEKEAEKLQASGLSRAEAIRQARIALGGLAQTSEETRQSRGVALVDSAARDIRFALRTLRSRKAFAAGVILTLALGIGANATMFGILDRILLRAPEGLRDQRTVHRVFLHRMFNGNPRQEWSFRFPDYAMVRQNSKMLSEVGAFFNTSMPVGEGDAVREFRVTAASASYFRFFDVQPVLGRMISEADDTPPFGAAVTVLGYNHWMTQYGGRDVLGEKLRIDRDVYTIVGVAPAGFTGVTDQQVPVAFIPITRYAYARRGASYTDSYNWSWLNLIVRRKPEVELQAASSEATVLFTRSWRIAAERDPLRGSVDSARLNVQLAPVQFARGPSPGRESRVATWVGGVSLIVLLIACANVANLLLARAVSRRKEIAMRLALGVSRSRLMRQLLTESAVLALIGAGAGLLLAQWGASGLRAFYLPDVAGNGVLTDGRTLLFGLAAAALVALLTGMAPALQAWRTDNTAAMQEGSRAGSYRRSRLRAGLLVFQAALSVLLLVGAALFVRSLTNVLNYRLGYDPDPVLLAWINVQGETLTEEEAVARSARIQDRLRSLPGVEHVTGAASIPFWSNDGRAVRVPGVDSVSQRGRFILQVGSYEYFQTMGTRIVSGRGFDASDRSTTEPVIVVSAGMARALWPADDPLGKCIIIGDEDDDPCRTVIGVAEDVRVRLLIDPQEHTYYLPATQFTNDVDPHVFVRTDGRPEDIAQSIRSAVSAELGGRSYVTVHPLRQIVDPIMDSWRFGATMFAAFGVLSLVLAAVGLYSTLAYDVSLQQHELSVRIALGATLSRVAGLVVLRGLTIVAAGVFIGGAIAWYFAPLLQDLLFEQQAHDLMIFVGVSLLLLVVGVAATVVPALRAARVDPTLVLR